MTASTSYLERGWVRRPRRREVDKNAVAPRDLEFYGRGQIINGLAFDAKPARDPFYFNETHLHVDADRRSVTSQYFEIHDQVTPLTRNLKGSTDKLNPPIPCPRASSLTARRSMPPLDGAPNRFSGELLDRSPVGL